MTPCIPRLLNVKTTISDKNLKGLQHIIKRQNAEKLQQKYETLAAVSQTQATIQLLLATEDYVGALELIAATKEVLRTELNGVHCLRHLGSQLTEMQKVVFAMLEQSFVGTAVDDFRLFCEPDNKFFFKTYDGNEALKEEELEFKSLKITPLLTSMVREQKLDVVAPYRKEVLGTKGPPSRPGLLNDVMRQCVARYLDELMANGSGSGGGGGGGGGGDSSSAPLVASSQSRVSNGTKEPTSLVDRLCTLPFDAWLAGMGCMYRELVEFLIRIQMMHQCINAGLDDIVNVDDSTGCVPASDGTGSGAGTGSTVQHRRSKSGSGGGDVGCDVAASAAAIMSPQQPTPPPDGGMGSVVSSASVDDGDLFQHSDVASDVASSPAVLDQADLLSMLDGTTKKTDSSSAGAVSPRRNSASGTPASLSQPSTSSSSADSTAASTPLAMSPKPHRRTPSGSIIGGHFRTPSGGLSAAQVQRIRDQSQKVLVDCCNEMHSRCSRLILKRKRASLDMAIFMREYEVAQEFIRKSEKVTGKTCAVLRNTLLAQARKLVDKFHFKQKEKILSHLANEMWEQRDVPQEFQLVVNSICTMQVTAGLPKSTKGSPAVAKTIKVGTEPFLAVNSLLMLTLILKDYFHCALQMPQIANNVLDCLMECVRLFNKRTKELVLRGEAEQNGTLRRILSKHLALASQTLSALLALLAQLRTGFAAILPEKMQPMLSSFDKVEGDFQVHLKEIMSIFTQQIEGVWANYEPQMKWSTLSVTPGARKVANDMGRLHKAIKPNLPASTLRAVFVSVFRSVNKKLSAVLKQPGLKKAVSVGIAADVVHYEEVLGGIDGMPIECLRDGLSELGLKLPGLIRAVSLAGAKR